MDTHPTHPTRHPTVTSRAPAAGAEWPADGPTVGCGDNTGRQSRRPRTDPTCPATAHGTVSAAKKARGGRCHCPEALTALAAERDRDRDRGIIRRQQRQNVHDDEGSVTAPPFDSPDVPAIPEFDVDTQRVLFGAGPACVGYDPELWFALDPTRVATAKRICFSCPLAGSCLTHALRHGEHGVWGGLSEAERAALRWRRWSWGLERGPVP